MFRSALHPAAVVLTVLVVVAMTSAAAAARPGIRSKDGSDNLALSLDGHTWRHAITTPLFAPATRWVPGDVRTERFFVRNDGPTGAGLTVAARVRDAHGLYAGDRLRLQVQTAGGEWARLRTGPVGTRIGHLHRSASTRVRVRARFVGGAGNPTMERNFSFRLAVRLTQGPRDAAPDDDGGALPDTGAPDLTIAAALALLLLTGGVVLTTRDSRKETP